MEKDFSNHAVAVRRAAAAAALALCAARAFAGIELVAPSAGATVETVPWAQRRIMAIPTVAEAARAVIADRTGDRIFADDRRWRKAAPFVVSWRPTDGEKRRWTIEIATKEDFSDARRWTVLDRDYDGTSLRNVPVLERDGDVRRYEIPRANLESGRTYYWRVLNRKRCSVWNCSVHCPCEEHKTLSVSTTGVFRTAFAAPRWIAIDGDVRNIRDLGAWRTEDGRRVRQGLVYRGEGLNENSTTGDARGRSRLTAEDVEYLKGTFGIRTDLDLRSKGETADMDASPLGAGVAFVQHSSPSYGTMFDRDGMATTAENFRLFCDRANYPIYFHCIGGADRTGSLAYVLNGVLGVSKHDLECDYEHTFYPNIPETDPNPGCWRGVRYFDEGLAKYGSDGESVKVRVERYLKDCGITDGEIAAFREIMLEPPDAPCPQGGK